MVDVIVLLVTTDNNVSRSVVRGHVKMAARVPLLASVCVQRAILADDVKELFVPRNVETVGAVWHQGNACVHTDTSNLYANHSVQRCVTMADAVSGTTRVNVGKATLVKTAPNQYVGEAVTMEGSVCLQTNAHVPEATKVASVKKLYVIRPARIAAFVSIPMFVDVKQDITGLIVKNSRADDRVKMVENASVTINVNVCQVTQGNGASEENVPSLV